MTLGKLIQRGFDNTLANWPLLLIRVAGSVAMTLVILVAIVPVAMFAIYSGTMTDIEALGSLETAGVWVMQNLVLIVALIIILTLILALAIALHSFVTGGVAGTYLDADRAAPPAGWLRSQFAVFTPDKWFHHAKRSWWQVFLIYNITWGVWAVVLLAPLLVVIPILMAAQDESVVAVMGCVAVVAWLMFAFFGSIFVHIWTELAILDCLRGQRTRVMGAIREGLAVFLANFGRILVLVVLMVVVTIAAGSFSVAMQFGFELGMSVDELAIIFIPIQILLSLIQTVVSVIVSAWLMACFAHLRAR